jgi:mannose-6-phosphate isomerase
VDPLDNPVRRYQWGSAWDIPALLGVPPDGSPIAELWMGAHPDAPSEVLRGGEARPLSELIAENPHVELGPAVSERYGARLPFLFKILAAARPLSLQVHPDKKHAEAAYAAEQRAGAAIRDYSDDNHKPELICALRDGFAALCGFRPLPQTIALLKELAAPELQDYVRLLADRPAATGLRAVVTAILTEQDDHLHTITAVQSACRRLAASSSHWAPACAAYAELTMAYPRDPGVLVALLLNHVVLAEGEALFVQAGVAHCYLRGFGAELMASSDNVLRAGLTAKRVNVRELLQVLDFRAASPPVLRPETDGVEETYAAPVSDFRLGRLRLGAHRVRLPAGRPQILICTGGTALLSAPGDRELPLRRGESAYLSALDTRISAAGHGTLLRATVGG